MCRGTDLAVTTRYHARLKASTVRDNNPPLRGARRAGEGEKESAAMGWRLGCGVTDHDLRRPGEGVKDRAGVTEYKVLCARFLANSFTASGGLRKS